MSADEVVNVDRCPDGVSVVTLNRPSALNAINTALLEGLVDALRALHDSGPIVVVGAGRAFCVGEDLKETLNPRTGGAEELRAAFEMLQDITRLMTSNPSPVIAAVNGFAVGGGAEIALAADLVVMSESARIRFPEVPIGHAHTGGISQRLPMLIGLLRAKELLMTGRWVDAAEAIRIGLVNESAPDALARALEVAQKLARTPARSLAATKRSVEASAFDNMELTLRLEVEAALYCFNSSEAQATFAEFARTGTVAGER
jgi:enoyl-CoA hydratase/carnithine racemase